MIPSGTSERPSNQRRHELLCAFTHVKVAWLFVGFTAFQVFQSWRYLEKPISAPASIVLPVYILILVFHIPAFLLVFRCFAERLVISITASRIAIAAVSWFAPDFFDPHTQLLRRIFLALCLLAFLVSLTMPVHAIRNPSTVTAPDIPETSRKSYFVWVAITAIACLLMVVLGYFIPWQ